MEFLTVTDYLLIASLLWLLVLSFFTIKAIRNISSLKKDGRKINLLQILENIVASQDHLSKKADQFENDIQGINLRANSYFQKFSLSRFNPFESTGGDQSFIITLLNGQNDGFIISSLHSRAGTRVYAKQVKETKATTHQFSKEEKEIVEKTAHLNKLKNKEESQIER